MLEPEASPIKIDNHLKLSELGIAENLISPGALSMESNKFICIYDRNINPAEAIFIEIKDTNNQFRSPFFADSITMNQCGTLIALKGKKNIQIFDFNQKIKIKATFLPEEIVFWKWISHSLLALVTESSVYHFSMDNETVPQKIFNRHSSLKNCQFNNYQCAPNKQWFLLAGILQTDHQTNGTLQLYSTKRKASQIIKADIASLATVKIGDNSEVSTILILFSSIAQKYNLHLIEVGTPPVGNQPYSKKEIAVMHQDQMDNPIAMQTSTQFDIIFLITKLGYIHIYDLETASCIFVNRISTDIIIVTAPHELSDGIITVNSKGQVISASIDKSQIIPYIKNELQNRELALRIAYRNNLSGAEDVCESKFHNLLQSGQYFNAARFAALSPQGYLRTYKTIEALRNMNDINEQRTSAVLEYFNILLDRGKLNNHETIEYCRIILPQDPKQCRKWLNLEKLLCTEELGNLMKQYDVLLALSVYICLNVHSKVVQCFIETGQFQEAISYALRVKYTPDYMQLLQTVMFLNSEQGALFAKELVVNKLCEINDIIDIFMEQKLVQQCTTFLLDVLTHNRAGDGQLQTRLLEINLLFSPKEADNIFEKKLFSHYDRIHIAKLCEKAGLNQRCLEHYTDFNDIKRCIVQTNSLSEDWIINFFEKLPVNDSLKYLQAMLTADIQKNYKICVQIGVKHHEKFDVNVLIDLFEQYGNSEVLFHFLTEISVKNGFPNEKFIQEIEKREGLGLLLQWLQKRINEDCKNPQIENLLILTAIKADRTQVGDYIKRLHNYDINSIASSAIRNELYEEAFMVFNKFKINTSAIKVLIENIGSLERAKTFAENSDDPAVWSILVDFQLKQGFVKESMKNYVKSKDSNMYTDIVCAAKSANLWSELIVFYEKLNYYDSAILEMMAHPKEAWQKNKFEEMINKVNNIELYYKAIKFYSERKPFLLSDILIIMSPYLDHQRAINMLKETRQLPLIKRYLYTVQSLNCQYINEALNEILIIENDYVGLQNSITMLDNYDKFKLAQQLKDHKFAKYRRIAASLYKEKGFWKESVELCKNIFDYDNAIKYSAESRNGEIVESLFSWILETKAFDYIEVCLRQCFDLIKPYIVLDLAWQYNVIGSVKCYMLQVFQSYDHRIEELEARVSKLEDKK